MFSSIKGLVVFPLLFTMVFGFKPVVIIHGLKQAGASMDTLKHNILSAHPETQLHVLDLYEKAASYEAPMLKQVDDFGAAVKAISDANPQGFHLIGFSQGGLIARGILEIVPNLNIDTFISLSSPQMGQFGEIASIKKYFPHFLRNQLHLLLYNSRGQSLSFGGYWKDPLHVDAYRRTSRYLPYLNNETSDAGHVTDSFKWKQNFLRVQKLVLIGGPDDGTINPWQSAQFGYYKDCEKGLQTIVPMRQQQVYLLDSFGLRTLDYQGKIIMHTLPGIKHSMMHRDPQVFETYIKNYLT